MTFALGRAKELGFPTDASVEECYGAMVRRGPKNDPAFNPYLIQCGLICTDAQGTGKYIDSMSQLLTTYYPTQSAAQASKAGYLAGVSNLPLLDPVNGYDFLGGMAVSYIAAIPAVRPPGTGSRRISSPRPLLNNNPKLAIFPAAKPVI